MKLPPTPMLTAIAAGLWVLSLFCDLLYLAGAEAALWLPLALYAMVGGLAAALAATLPGALRIGLARIPVDLIVATFYAVNLWLRLGDPAPMQAAIALSVLGVGMLAVSSWLGAGKARAAV